MARSSLTRKEETAIDEAINHFTEFRYQFEGMANALVESFLNDSVLRRNTHFIKMRLKSPSRLKQKLVKKALSLPRDSTPEITADNLFEKINDLAGIRIIHLYTGQISVINENIEKILKQEKYNVIEGPIANCWDIEYETIFNKMGIKTKSRDSMYSSIHYIVQANTRNPMTLEIQVRTLTDEVWGEVSHMVEYDTKKSDKLINDQLKVLARMTTGSTRLIDCIFYRKNNE